VSGSPAIAARNAIEALRAGVPNRAAIRLLGSNEDSLRGEFLGRLVRCRAALAEGRQVDGLLLAGAFGAGKSHQLGYLGELAQQENFVVSLVPISKEAPLFDPARLFAAAIRVAAVPRANDDVMTAVMSRLKPNSASYDELEEWTTAEVQSGRLASLFAALLHLIPRGAIDADAHARMARFFGGGKLGVMMARGWLRAAGAGRLFNIRAVREADLALQRLRFAPRLLRAAGFSGWCVLLDEVELIGRYSPLQRGRSYAELARWLGLEKGEEIPGLLTVAAVTSDFHDEMFNRRRDDELIPPRLEERGMQRQAVMARKGIEWLERHQSALNPPTEAALGRSLEKIARLYHDVYGWAPPATAVGQVLASTSMRQHVKSWITIWDIERLYGVTPRIEADTIAIDYSESTDIEQATVSADDESIG
jgi:hypothetical protein